MMYHSTRSQVQKISDSVLSAATQMASGQHYHSSQFLPLLIEIKDIEKTAKEEKDTVTKQALYRFDTIMKKCNENWSKLNGDNLIDSIEKEWTQWSIDDALKWFDLILKMEKSKEDGPKFNDNNCDSDSDYEIDDYSSGSSSSDGSESDFQETIENNINNDDEKERELKKSNRKIKSGNEINFQDIKSRLEATAFRARKDLPFFIQPFNFKQCGFKNKKDCEILCKHTKQLIEKYPKEKKMKSRKSIVKHSNVNDDDDLEGVVQDTVQ